MSDMEEWSVKLRVMELNLNEKERALAGLKSANHLLNQRVVESCVERMNLREEVRSLRAKVETL